MKQNAKNLPSPGGRGQGEGDLTSVSRRLRSEQTDAEKALWLQVRNRRLQGLKFRRQVEIEQYIADFVCFEKRLIVELDGGQHGEDHAIEKDRQRTEFLEGKSFLVMRFWNNEVLKNMEGVLLSILEAANTLTPALSLEGEGEEGRRFYA